MEPHIYRIGIAGAASLAGKELSEDLAESQLADAQIVLLDSEEAAGQLETAGDEVSFIRRIDREAFDKLDFVFLLGSEETARASWRFAQEAGANSIDVTSVLENEAGVMVFSPWVEECFRAAETGKREPDLKTAAVVVAHPAAVMLALLTARMKGSLAVRSFATTVFEPASQYGKSAMDELHQQTVNLLSFQSLPREMYDTQVSFNMVPSFGEAGKLKLSVTEDRIRRHYAALSEGRLPALAIQLAHAPVFHGYVASIFVELEAPATVEDVERALQGDHVDMIVGEGDAPSNLTAAGQEDILVRVRPEPAGAEPTTRFWLWAAADNLKLVSLNAVACALELRKLRPQGKVQ